MTINYIQDCLIIPLELMCCKVFLEIFCTHKNKWKMWCRVLLSCFLCIMVYIVAILFGNFFYIKEIFLINILAIYSKVYWCISLKKSYALIIIFQSFVVAADYLTIGIYECFLEEISNHNSFTQSMIILLSKLILFFIAVILRFFLKRVTMGYLKDNVWIKFCFFPVFTFCVIAAFMSKSDIIINKGQDIIFWTIGFGLVGMNIYMFYLICDIGKTEHILHENRIFEINAMNKLQMYELISENMEQQKAISHEYKNQIKCIQSLLNSERYDELKKYIIQITGDMLGNLEYIDTNHIIINAILNEKYRQSFEKGITMICRIGDLHDINIEEKDITVLLFNLFNNAFEACEKCAGEKIVKFKIMLENEELILAIKNTYDGNIIFKDGEYITTKKKDAFNHGMGIKNIIRIVKKYQGYYSIEHTQQEFSISIIIPQSNKSACY